MSGDQVAVAVALVAAGRFWYLRHRVATLTRRRDNADRCLNQTLRRWF